MLIDISQHQLGTVEKLLTDAGLPTSDIANAEWVALVGWFHNETLAEVERWDGCALLRSVVVNDRHQGQGIAANLVKHLHQRTVDAGFKKSYLMTMDADAYFKKHFDYCEIERPAAPEGIKQSTQYTGTCPGSAVLMKKSLT